MMTRIKIFILFFFLLPSLCFAFDDELNAQAALETQEVPEGMEIISVTDGHTLIVPEGAKIRRVGAHIIVEGDKEYYSRRFYEMSQEIDELKSLFEKMQERFDKVQKAIDRQEEVLNKLTDKILKKD